MTGQSTTVTSTGNVIFIPYQTGDATSIFFQTDDGKLTYTASGNGRLAYAASGISDTNRKKPPTKEELIDFLEKE